MSFHRRPKATPMEVVKVGPIDESVKGNSTPLEMNVSYINGTTMPITIVMRSGLSYVVPPQRPALHGDLIIRVRFKIKKEVNTDIHGLLSSIEDDSPVELKLLREAMLGSHMNSLHGMESYGVDYRIHPEDLMCRGGNVYVTDLDIVISSQESIKVANHPYSDPAIRQRLIESEEDLENDESFNYNIRIVDNNGRFGPRFININNKIFKVPVTKNGMLKSGVYTTSSGSVDGDYDYAYPVCEKYGFEEADDEIGLYHSYDEAKTLGDMNSSRKREMDERSHELKLAEQDMKLEKLERERELETLKKNHEEQKTLLEKQLKEREAELSERTAEIKTAREELEHKRKLEELHRKFDYETRSSGRKETLEVLKFVPMFITGCLALYTALNKGGK